MSFIIGLLTAVMVLDCFALVLLVLVQLPKKEAGAGLAFGGAATDALFGAGSGNVLTKVTKYAATIFFVLAMLLAFLQKNFHSRSVSEFEKSLGQQKATQTSPLLPGGATASAGFPAAGSNAATAAAATASNLISIPIEMTNMPAAAGTNAGSPAPQK